MFQQLQKQTVSRMLLQSSRQNKTQHQANNQLNHFYSKKRFLNFSMSKICSFTLCCDKETYGVRKTRLLEKNKIRLMSKRLAAKNNSK